MLPQLQSGHLLAVVALLVLIAVPVLGADTLVYHTVEAGETLSRIAERYGTTVENLASINDLNNPNSIRVGQVLVVAIKPSVHVVRQGESLWTIARGYGVTVDSILLFNDLPDPDHVLPGQQLIIPPAGGHDVVAVMALQALQRQETMLWPLKEQGIISSMFGPRNGRVHKGLDIAAPTGTPILAAADGRVTYADWAGTYGMLVVIDHGNGVLTRYAHASAIHVKAGQTVKAGHHIADVGSTGRSTGPHLHFEVEVRGEAVDPLTMLPTGR